MVSHISCSVWDISALMVPFPISWHAVCWGFSQGHHGRSGIGVGSCTRCPAVEQSQWGITSAPGSGLQFNFRCGGYHTLVQMVQARADPACWLRPPGPSAAMSTEAYLGLVPLFSPGIKLQPLHHFPWRILGLLLFCDFFFLLESSRKFFVCLFCFCLLLSGRKGEDSMPFLHLMVLQV